MTWHLSEQTYKTVRETAYEVALLPIGSCEPHNFHLPYGTDTLQADGIANLVCESAASQGAKVVKLPCIPYGVQTNMRELPLAINVNPSTFFALLKDIMRSLEDSGIGKLLILNGHGGNDFLKPFVREMMGQSQTFIAVCDWWKVGQDVYDEIFEVRDDHAGEMETSVILSLAPQLVDLSNAADGATKKTQFEAINKGYVSISRRWDLLTESTGTADPRAATSAKGEAYLQVVVERLAGFVVELSAASIDKQFPFEK
jgi:creatinine amidohydrolase